MPTMTQQFLEITVTQKTFQLITYLEAKSIKCITQVKNTDEINMTTFNDRYYLSNI
jgi:hypothetical protein